MNNIFEENKDPEKLATELIRAQQRREIRFRLNIILAILVMLLVLNAWRVYRNEEIWARCVTVHPEMMGVMGIQSKERTAK
jgi:hypothetical protein